MHFINFSSVDHPFNRPFLPLKASSPPRTSTSKAFRCTQLWAPQVRYACTPRSVLLASGCSCVSLQQKHVAGVYLRNGWRDSGESSNRPALKPTAHKNSAGNEEGDRLAKLASSGTQELPVAKPPQMLRKPLHWSKSAKDMAMMKELKMGVRKILRTSK
ncbi:hypothetical protein FIBSPDRAFT_858565 [Athelia psychrophila]|uniref:Uncharacterized protein n=1 Tax=Athelia psychrophila TaxID=1759441 RepID=A0A166LT99_9AGAM|nr:hypothetical protein FIBSPDRAFT_858565 [Fibularhizoctonia sp. CBS 109695]